MLGHRGWLSAMAAVAALAIAGVTMALPVRAQGTELPCGAVVAGNMRQARQGDYYTITLYARDKLQLSLAADGEAPALALSVRGPGGQSLFAGGLKPQLAYASDALAAGTYTVAVANHRGASEGGRGAYTLSLSCTRASGEVVEAGRSITIRATPRPATAQPGEGPRPPVRPTIVTKSQLAGVRFPGLPPVDFSTAEQPALPFTKPITITDVMENRAVYAIPFAGTAGDALDLAVTRQSGNLNVGVVVLTAQSGVLFQASLVTADSVATRITLPATGQYILGIYRMNLSDPPRPARTMIQITARPVPRT